MLNFTANALMLNTHFWHRVISHSLCINWFNLVFNVLPFLVNMRIKWVFLRENYRLHLIHFVWYLLRRIKHRHILPYKMYIKRWNINIISHVSLIWRHSRPLPPSLRKNMEILLHNSFNNHYMHHSFTCRRLNILRSEEEQKSREPETSFALIILALVCS